MVYKLIVTERAEEQLDECLYYLVYRLGNNIAAEHLLTPPSQHQVYQSVGISGFFEKNHEYQSNGQCVGYIWQKVNGLEKFFQSLHRT